MSGMRGLLLQSVSKAVGLLGMQAHITRLASDWWLEESSWKLKRRQENCFQILTYHRVNSDRDPFFAGVQPEVFARQVAYLKRYYQVVDLHEVIDGKPIPERAICLTFDDGYLDNYTNAFPVLREAGVPATIFLATGVIGNGRFIWHDEVFHAFRGTLYESLDWPGTPFDRLPLTPLPIRCQTMERCLEFIRRLSPSQRDLTISELQHRLGVQPKSTETERVMLNWDEVREMANEGVSFGAHTVNHSLLSTISGDELYREIGESCRAIEKNLGISPQLFAYPNGRPQDYNSESIDALRGAGLKAAVTTRFGVNIGTSDPFLLKRMSVTGNDGDVFGCRVGWYRLTSAS